MIFATGTNGTIGSQLPKNVMKIQARLEKISMLDIPKFDPNDQLIHLAGIVGKASVELDVEYSRKVNIFGTNNLALLSLEKGIGKFIYISTSHVYAYSDDLLTEQSPTNPQSLYAEQKLEAEDNLISIFRNANEINRLVILRIFSVLDLGAKEFTLGGALEAIIHGRRKDPIKYCSDVRDFMTPKKIAEALMLIAGENEIHGVYNLCTQEPRSVYEAAKSIFIHENFSEYKRFLQPGFSNAPRIVGSNLKLKSELPSLQLNWSY